MASSSKLSTNLSNSKKRPLSRDALVESETPQKIVKVFPIFAKQSQPSSTASFQWLAPLGPKRTCLHGVNLSPRASTTVAAFDLDGTLLQSHIFKKKKSPSEWKWWKDVVPKKLKEVHNSGSAVVLISNQAIRSSQLEEWKKKISLVASALPDVPFRLLAATAKDGYRKPMPGMWYELERVFKAEGVEIDKATSFYVGDAAGRPNDFASTDRKFALNVELPFHTPEAYFLNLSEASYKLPGFNVSSLESVPRILPVGTSIIPATAASFPEIVLFVGFPCIGKSSFYRQHFRTAGYAHINQDTLGSRPKCLKAVDEAIRAGKSCVIDNTNRDVQTRRHYIELARKSDVRIRCFYFRGSVELAWHNNLYRAFNLPASIALHEPHRDFLPYMAFSSFAEKFEEPKESEGFLEVITVNWLFEGSKNEQRNWSMWLQIDGK
ncbi:hypothetical protein HETIRDRAFT_470728 [Heterobasidion irregulare TC 32-1]|uniref:PNK3P-domain-containing protein n=1 Tax=Heterobasidion irregulare (strain TC 32-1) TaxID=747525 RepID=W4KIF6_HETIT|nr:uncharacterized protein HETIRDRAFT_470728 [Heterobasidion irregulare TC 32-1]ETW85637.1 hypothetical protein HETIRDRAFT_470728 [Heterobasidion irregulare TC 32-1]